MDLLFFSSPQIKFTHWATVLSPPRPPHTHTEGGLPIFPPAAGLEQREQVLLIDKKGQGDISRGLSVPYHQSYGEREGRECYRHLNTVPSLTAKQNTPKPRGLIEQFIVIFHSSVAWLGLAGWFSLGGSCIDTAGCHLGLESSEG